MRSPLQMLEDKIGLTVEQLLYGYGAKLNVPWKALKGVDEVVDFTRDPSDYIERRRMARELLANSRWRGFMPKDKGYCFIDPAIIPSLGSAVKAAQALQGKREKDFVHTDAKAEAFRTGILSAEDLKTHPEMMEFALDRNMIEIVSDYLGTLPRLWGADFMYSIAKSEDAHNSQLWHLDKPEVNYIQVFICLNEIGDKNGPFTFLPAGPSQRVCEETGYHHRSSLGNGRMVDEEFNQHRKTDPLVSLIGKPGSALIVDTSRCLHFGARIKEGYRSMLGFRYAPAHRMRQQKNLPFGLEYAMGDAIRIKLLSGRGVGTIGERATGYIQSFGDYSAGARIRGF